MPIGNIEFALNAFSKTDEEKRTLLADKIDEGDFDAIRAFIYSDNPEHAHNRNLALKVTIEKNCIPLALELIGLKDFGDSKEQEELITHMVKTATIDTFILFMTNLGASEDEWYCALYDAIDCNNALFLDYILSNREIKPRDLGNVLFFAAEKRNLIFMQLILNKGGISPRDLGHTASQCIRNDFKEGLILLLDKGLLNGMALQMAIKTAYLIKNHDALEFLLSLDSLKEHSLFGAFGAAAEAGDLKMMDRFIATGLIGISARSSAVSQATKKKQWETVSFLMSQGSISEYSHSNLLEDLCKAGEFDMALHYFIPAVLDTRSRSELLLTALNANRPDVALIFFNSGEISDTCRFEAVVQAARLNFMPILGPLLARGPISDEIRGQALVQAATHHQGDAMAILVQNGPIERQQYEIARAHCIERDDLLAILETATTYNWFHCLPCLASGEDFAPSGKIYVNVATLKENPRIYLEEVATRGLLSIGFLNPDGSLQPGIDAGGLSKQFVHQLIEALFEKEVICTDDKRIPKKSGSDDDLVNLGRFLSAIYLRNQTRIDKIYTGQIFDKKTFMLLKTVLDPSLTEKEKLLIIANALKDETNALVVDFASNPSPSAEEIAAIRVYLTSYVDESSMEASLDELVETCLSFTKEGSFKALSLIASGLSEPLTSAIIADPELAELALQGNGHFTKEEIFEKMTCIDADIAQKFEWIKEKIAEEFEIEGSTWVQRFLFCVTGQPVLPAGSLIFRGTTEAICIAHTCFCTIDLPRGEPSCTAADAGLSPKEKFIKNLEITMSVTDYGIT